MSFADFTAWRIILALALMSVGGLVLWAYGLGDQKDPVDGAGGLEAEATRNFHRNLSSWFLTYGIILSITGLVLLLWAASVLVPIK